MQIAMNPKLTLYFQITKRQNNSRSFQRLWKKFYCTPSFCLYFVNALSKFDIIGGKFP